MLYSSDEIYSSWCAKRHILSRSDLVTWFAFLYFFSLKNPIFLETFFWHCVFFTHAHHTTHHQKKSRKTSKNKSWETTLFAHFYFHFFIIWERKFTFPRHVSLILRIFFWPFKPCTVNCTSKSTFTGVWTKTAWKCRWNTHNTGYFFRHTHVAERPSLCHDQRLTDGSMRYKLQDRRRKRGRGARTVLYSTGVSNQLSTTLLKCFSQMSAKWNSFTHSNVTQVRSLI